MQENFKAAVAPLQEAARLAPTDAEARRKFGSALARVGDLDGAIKELRQAIALDPNLARAHNSLGLALDKKGDRPAAIVALREAVRLAPHRPKLHFDLGTTLHESGEGDGYEALIELQEAIRLDPDYVGAYQSLGNVYINRREGLKNAEAAYSAAIRLNPEHGKAHFGLGWTLLKSGRLDEARDSFLRAKKLSPKIRGLKRGLVTTAFQTGRYAMAFKELFSVRR